MPRAELPPNEEMRIGTLLEYDILDTAPDPALDRITRHAAKLFGVRTAVVSLVDSDRQWFKSCVGLDATQTPRDAAICAHTILKPTINYIPDATQDPRTRDNPLVTGPPHIRFYCGAPLVASDGSALGALCLIDPEPRPGFSDADQALLMDLAGMVVEQIILRRDARQVVREVERCSAAEAALTATQGKLAALIEHVPAAIALLAKDGRYLARSDEWVSLQRALFAPDRQDNFLEGIQVREDWVRAYHAVLCGKTVTRQEDRLLMQDGSADYVTWTLKPWLSEAGQVRGLVLSATTITDQVRARLDAERQNELLDAVLQNVEDGIVACDEDGHLTLFNRKTRAMHGIDAVSLPIEECGSYYSLYEGDGYTPLAPDRVPLFRALAGETVQGQPMVIAPGDLPKRDILATASQLRDRNGRVIGAVASMSDVTAAKVATQKLKDSRAQALHIAFHDPLTGLGNRAHFNKTYAAADDVPADRPVAALFVDLDRFKFVNDTLGHKAGDDLLVRVSAILSRNVPDGSSLTRLGGDEFVCVVPVTGPEEAMAVAAAIAADLDHPVAIGGQTVVTGASIGVAVSPVHGSKVTDLARRADIAMFRSKASGTRTPVLFEPVHELHAMQRTRLEGELIHSIEKGELRTVFQPIMDSSTGEIGGVEALVRWQHPHKGLVGPDVFIPIAEECGFIVALGEWVLEDAVTRFAAHPDLFVSVNVSPVQFRDPELIDKIMAILERTGFDPHRLELEVTESLLINDASVAGKVIARLKALGVRVALDDFGTGYSSLAYIQQIPFNKVKIDRSFVQTIGSDDSSEPLIRCVVDLASALGMTVTAEGVETDQHEAVLKLIGCHTLQGFKYSRPLAFDDLARSFGLDGAHAPLRIAG
ncbi:MAG: EAL domain-containing protein [Litorimonas sp.]